MKKLVCVCCNYSQDVRMHQVWQLPDRSGVKWNLRRKQVKCFFVAESCMCVGRRRSGAQPMLQDEAAAQFRPKWGIVFNRCPVQPCATSSANFMWLEFGNLFVQLATSTQYTSLRWAYNVLVAGHACDPLAATNHVTLLLFVQDLPQDLPENGFSRCNPANLDIIHCSQVGSP